MADYLHRDATHHPSARRPPRRTRERQRSQAFEQPSYPFSTFSTSDSSGGSSRQYGSSDYSRGRRSSASSFISSRSDPYFQDDLPRRDPRYFAEKKKSTTGKALDQVLDRVVPLVGEALSDLDVQPGDIANYIEVFKHPPVKSSRWRGWPEQTQNIDITQRLQAVAGLVYQNHGKNIRKLVLTAVLSKVTKLKI